MQVKFKDGTITGCSSPTEQKLFKSGESAGWILNFALLGDITSDNVDKLLMSDNVSELTFISKDENETETAFTLSNYNRVSSAVIRYSEPQNKSRVDIQLTKGV